MTVLTGFCAVIREWLNLGEEVYSNATVTSWLRICEENINVSCESKHMVQIDTGVISVDRVLLPTDWIKLDFVRMIDGNPLKFRERTEFYTPNADDTNDNQGYYTLTGNYLIVGNPDADGKNIEISYYQNVPPLGDEANWVYTNFQGMLLFGTLAVAAMYSVEDERAPGWQSAFDAIIGRINDKDTIAKTSGSVLKRNRPRSF